jgi:hypothetical protein
MKKKIIILSLIRILFILFLVNPVILKTAFAKDRGWVNTGYGLGVLSSKADEQFYQHEAFIVYRLPLDWKMTDWVEVNLRGTSHTGLIGAANTDAFYGALGLSLGFVFLDEKLILDTGGAALLLTEEKFGETDLGGKFQFMTYLGLSFKIIQYFGLGYRFHHISNADFFNKNDGFNMHMTLFNYFF